jgi:hypothetical protein
VLFLGIVAGLIVAAAGSASTNNAAYLLLAPLTWILALLIFLPLYFTPTWARAYAAGQVVDAEERWASN